jgi:type VI secretion system protein ImpG
MRDELLLYYERELSFLREMGAEFAEKYPKIASRLQFDPANEAGDPHVERLMQAFALLAGRIHLKLDDEFPEITEAILGIVYPHLIRPIPSMAIAEFELDLERGKLTTGLPIPRGTVLYSRPVGGVPCKFRTCSDLTLWPLAVTGAEWRTPDRLKPPLKASEPFVIRLGISSHPDAPLPKLGIRSLRFHLTGESSLVHALYEQLCAKLTRIVIRDPRNPRLLPITLPAFCMRPCGFAEDEAMLPYPRRSFPGYRILQEFFMLPAKFLFVELVGPPDNEGNARPLGEVFESGFSDQAELLLFFSTAVDEDRRERLEIGLGPKLFRLGCVPIVNLFPQTAEPILFDQHKYEYPVRPDIRRPLAVEVFSVDQVGTIDPGSRQIITYRPFYSYHHDTESSQDCFWIANRRMSSRANDEGSDIYLTLVDRSMRPARPKADTLTVHTTCTNRNLPSRLPWGNEDGDFELEGNAPIKRIIALTKPTQPLRPPVAKMALWQLISHLSLNYLSLVQEGRSALQQILRLYDFTDSPFSQRMIDGIISLNSKPHFARVVSENGIAFARGVRVEMELDEEQFVGGGIFLFASVVEHFLAQYVSLNSFTQLSVKTRQRREPLKEWPPRAGLRILA